MDHAQTTSASEDEQSIAGSDITDVTTDAPSRRKRRRRRTPRTSTRYVLAQPAPQLRTKQRRLVQIRPRLLLQLQEIGDKRVLPAFDLVPPHLIAGTIIIPKLTRMFGHSELGQNDVLLVRNELYGSPPESPLSTDEESSSHEHSKDVLAVISSRPDSSGTLAEIVLEDESQWRAAQMVNGSFEFTCQGEQGQSVTARWVRRSGPVSRQAVSPVESVAGVRDEPVESRWTFSIIDPSSRRHPILGSLTHETLEVYDTYNTLSTSSGRFPPTKSFGHEASAGDRTSSPGGFGSETRATMRVTPEHRSLMIASASWIRLHQQGWPASANPKFARPLSHCRPASVGSVGAVRRQTFPSYDGGDSRAGSPSESPRLSQSGQAPHHEWPKPPARAMSTGRAFMRRRSAKMESPPGEATQPMGKPEKEKEKDEEVAAKMCGSVGLGRLRHWTRKLLGKTQDAGVS